MSNNNGAIKQRVTMRIVNESGATLYYAYRVTPRNQADDENESWLVGTPAIGMSNGIYPAMRRIELNLPHIVEYVTMIIEVQR